MKKLCSISLVLQIGCFALAARAMTPEECKSYQQMLLQNLPSVLAFEAWIQKSQELPPDFDALPRNNSLPDPLSFFNGKSVKTAADWKARRSEILELYQKYVWGKAPPLPKFDHAEVQDTPASGYRTRTGKIFCGPGGEGSIRITMQIPDGPGPFPVVMGPGLVGGFGRASAEIIRKHGYAVCSIAANDGNDDSIKLASLYPECDPGALPRRGWAASAVVDYLLMLPEVDAKRIAVTGYSRDGKAMAIGAALDERIAAVIAGSPGVGGILPFRAASEFNQSESIQSTTLMFPDWLHPRVRYFAGREDRLPVDGNLLLAAIAPRPFFLVGGLNDEVSNNWGDEQAFHSANKVYKLLGEDAEATGKLGLLKVPGNHGANDWEQAMAWLDFQFGRSDKKWTNRWQFPWDWEKWKAASGETIDLAKYPDRQGAQLLEGVKNTGDWEKKSVEARKQIEWMLGDSTAAAAAPAPPERAPQQDVPAWVIRRSSGARAISEFGWYGDYNSRTASRPFEFNQSRGAVKGTLYYPTNAKPDAKLPVVIWLHSYSYPLGYMWVYRRDVHPILALVDAGYAVLAYDQSGFGSRMDETSQAYQDKFPHWSQMGRMVDDARAAVAALSADPLINPKSIYLFGYGLGGSVALYTAALEPKVAGVVCVAGFTPLRTDTATNGTGGIARYAVDRPLLPRLGFFIGNESKIPYDFDDVMACIAPRPIYVVNPQYDRGANYQDVHAALGEARKVFALYQAEDRLQTDEPWDYDRMSGNAQDRIVKWMRENMK
jgi:dienelactone hydrolase